MQKPSWHAWQAFQCSTCSMSLWEDRDIGASLPGLDASSQPSGREHHEGLMGIRLSTKGKLLAGLAKGPKFLHCFAFHPWSTYGTLGNTLTHVSNVSSAGKSSSTLSWLFRESISIHSIRVFGDTLTLTPLASTPWNPSPPPRWAWWGAGEDPRSEHRDASPRRSSGLSHRAIPSHPCSKNSKHQDVVISYEYIWIIMRHLIFTWF